MVDNDKSTSSADPSSSSAGNTTGNNSVAPSTSSGDGSVVKSQLNKLSEARTNLNQKVQESEEKLEKLLRDVKNLIISRRLVGQLSKDPRKNCPNSKSIQKKEIDINSNLQ